MFTTFALVLVVVGLLGLFATLLVIYKPLYTAQLSLNPFGGSTKEHHQGLSLKWPWATLQQPEISMRSEIIVTSGGILVMAWEKFLSEKVYERIAPRIYETKDSVVFGSWAAAIRPRRGSLRELLLKTPQVAALMAMSEVDLAISDFLATQETSGERGVLHRKREISELSAGVFGGNNEEVSSPFEEQYGVVVSNPRLFDLNLGKRSQDAAEKLFESKKFREAMEDLASQIADPEKRANAVLLATGVAKKNIYNIEGLEGGIKALAEAFIIRRTS